MLKALRIRNFRSIVEADLDFGKVNLFIGPNGGGKSNVLEAVGIASSALSRSIEPIDLDLKGVRLSLPRLFKSTFKNRNIPKGFSIEAETGRALYTARIIAGDDSTTLQFSHESLREDGRLVLERGPRGAKIHSYQPGTNLLETVIKPDPARGMYDVYRGVFSLSREALDELDRLASYVIYAPQTALLRGAAADPRSVEPLGLTGGRLAEAVEEILAYAATGAEQRKRMMGNMSVVWKSGWPNQVRVEHPLSEVVPRHVPSGPTVLYFRDRFMQTTRNLLSAFDASEGTLYLLFVAPCYRTQERPESLRLIMWMGH